MAPFARGGLHPAGEASNHKSESHLHFTTEQETAHSGPVSSGRGILMSQPPDDLPDYLLDFN